MNEPPIVLIVEDGDEYLENLSRFAPGPRYLQAHSAAQALQLLGAHEVGLVYLDMRFDRIPERDLVGDRASVTRSHGSDVARALRYLARNQGLFILEALRAAGHGAVPVILAYDFSGETGRFERLAAHAPGADLGAGCDHARRDPRTDRAPARAQRVSCRARAGQRPGRRFVASGYQSCTARGWVIARRARGAGFSRPARAGRRWHAGCFVRPSCPPPRNPRCPRFALPGFASTRRS